ncbi:Cell division control protein 48 C isoform 1 [Tripterygium wilfordii]|uniref:Cell division control protein 48 C isoform 1 n=1 Tax=Tripterygium wilfordii TaxID=458696 RepID=A0A7J7C001_TRIWF|nr:cell division control protein 48 homolog C [Tripterygium wilfordii]KAF5727245.1 Cell division control protein 48 C isoform 1 [Tripterygium wilfordii]
MVRRFGRSGHSSVVDRETLVRRLKDCQNRYRILYADEIVSHLRSKFPDYSRIKQQPFSRLVNQMIHQENSRKTKKPSLSTFKYDDEDEEKHDRGSRRKKMRKTDEKHERLLCFENAFLKNKQQSDQGGSSSPSSSSKSSSDEEDGAVSTSEDAIYGMKLEPQIDLLQSTVREKYVELGTPKLKEKENNVELEVVSGNNRGNKIDLASGGRGGEGLVAEPNREGKRLGSTGSSGGSEVKAKDGPKFRDLGGMGGVLEELKMEVMVPLYHPRLPQWLGVRPMAGILLHGPPGCGKTKLAHAIANETGVPFYKISATEVVSGVSGASEENIRELFSKAYKTAPSIVFIDEIDAIAAKRDNLQREMERRIVTQLMTCMDESHRLVKSDSSSSEVSDHRPGYVLVIGATNRPDAVDSALRRPGRFDREIVLGVPDETARVEILSVLTQNMRLEGSFNLMKIARSTPGFVGADLAAIANKAGNLAMRRIFDQRKVDLSREYTDEEHTEEWLKRPWLPEEMEKLAITMDDFEEAVKIVQPSSRREGFSTIPGVKWEDVGGLDSLRGEFERYIVRRIKYPEDYLEFGIDLETGFLLYGPPGCGKTLIAKAVANEAGANFIHIKGPELLNKYVGESELAVRTLFSRARACSPCILFFDEVDALTTKRGSEGGWVIERLLNQLLIELDGAEQRRGVFVIGATNRPDVMDRAVLRPGRFGKLLYIPLPNPNDRGLILKALAREKPVDVNVDLSAIGQMEACKNFSGADLSSLMNEAAMVALEDKLSNTSGRSCSDMFPQTIKMEHFERALAKISPSVSEKQIQHYHRLANSFNAA